MGDMVRDLGDMKKEYVELLAKKEQSQLATSLERQQQGAQFRVVDPPSLPDKPSFPDRFKFSLGAIAVGLALAVLFGFGSEVLDDRILSEQVASEAVNLPILCEIPPLPTPREILYRPLEALGGCRGSHYMLAILLPSAVAYAYLWG